MRKEEKLNMIFDNLADGLNITQTMMKKAETAYNAYVIDIVVDILRAQNLVDIFAAMSYCQRILLNYYRHKSKKIDCEN